MRVFDLTRSESLWNGRVRKSTIGGGGNAPISDACAFAAGLVLFLRQGKVKLGVGGTLG